VISGWTRIVVSQNLCSTITHIPQPDSVVLRRCEDDQSAIWREVEGQDITIASFETFPYVLRVYFPDLENKICG
jgi:hypothetical protein